MSGLMSGAPSLAPDAYHPDFTSTPKIRPRDLSSKVEFIASETRPILALYDAAPAWWTLELYLAIKGFLEALSIAHGSIEAILDGPNLREAKTTVLVHGLRDLEVARAVQTAFESNEDIHSKIPDQVKAVIFFARPPSKRVQEDLHNQFLEEQLCHKRKWDAGGKERADRKKAKLDTKNEERVRRKLEAGKELLKQMEDEKLIRNARRNETPESDVLTRVSPALLTPSDTLTSDSENEDEDNEDETDNSKEVEHEEELEYGDEAENWDAVNSENGGVKAKTKKTTL